jgi:hypothetical protein
MDGDQVGAQKFIDEGKAVTDKMAAGLIEIFPQLKGTDVASLLTAMPTNDFISLVQQKMSNYRQDRELVDNEQNRAVTREGHVTQDNATYARMLELSGKSPKEQFAAWNKMADDLNNFLEKQAAPDSNNKYYGMQPDATGLMMETVARVRAGLANGKLPEKKEQEILIKFWNTSGIKTAKDVPTPNTDMKAPADFMSIILSDKGPQMLLDYANRTFGAGAYTIEDIKFAIQNMLAPQDTKSKKKK